MVKLNPWFGGMSVVLCALLVVGSLSAQQVTETIVSDPVTENQSLIDTQRKRDRDRLLGELAKLEAGSERLK